MNADTQADVHDANGFHATALNTKSTIEISTSGTRNRNPNPHSGEAREEMIVDKYDEAVEFLKKNPELIKAAWSVPSELTDAKISQAHCLFKYATPTGRGQFSEDGKPCGCLTQVRLARYTRTSNQAAYTPELTRAIRCDSRLPTQPDKIKSRHLKVFAEWQRKLDKELNRT